MSEFNKNYMVTHGLFSWPYIREVFEVAYSLTHLFIHVSYIPLHNISLYVSSTSTYWTWYLVRGFLESIEFGVPIIWLATIRLAFQIPSHSWWGWYAFSLKFYHWWNRATTPWWQFFRSFPIHCDEAICGVFDCSSMSVRYPLNLKLHPQFRGILQHGAKGLEPLIPSDIPKGA